MSERTIVVALGGNALAPPGERATIANQFRHTRESLVPIVELAKEGWHIAVVHGNGPQVGDTLARNEMAAPEIEPLPLGVLVAETAGWIGYMIQQSLQNALWRAGLERGVVTLITQTLVPEEEAHSAPPVKAIGHELSPARLARLREAGVPVAQGVLGEWRRMTPSPTPQAVVEGRTVRRLVESGTIVVAAGGGGPPVYRDARLGFEGVDAVVDKDRTAAILARELGADVLLILTNVPAVYRDYGTPRAAPIRAMGVAEAERLLAAGQFGAGSMRPKVEAAVAFARSGGRAVIAALDQGPAALRGETGTTITDTGS